jgi:hypothetical protein
MAACRNREETDRSGASHHAGPAYDRPVPTTDADGHLVPTSDEEGRFWSLIEQAWRSLGEEPDTLRRRIAARELAGEDAYEIDEFLEEFLEKLGDLTADLTDEELVDLDRVLERKLYDIDRAEIQAITDGSDDGFLYCRGFIVAIGREFYDAVNADPTAAILDAECEEMCYFFAHAFSDRHGDFPETGSGISRESVSNAAGWPDLAG